MQKTVLLTISGKVQGVNYRNTARDAAKKSAITGYARNLETGDVEITATGNENDLATFIDWCRHGPANAQVSNVEITDLPFQSFDSFTIRR